MDYTYKVIRRDVDWDINRPMNLYFFGDIHYGTKACDTDRFKWFLERTAKDKDAYYFCMGDIFDFASTKERKSIDKAELHDQTIERFDDMVSGLSMNFAQTLKQMNGKRLFGIIQGNHTWRYTTTAQKGKYVEEELSERLNTQYLGWLCVYALNFNFSNKRTKTVYFVLCHGRAGGKLLGTSINQVVDLRTIFPFADVYAMGHNHDRGAWPTTVLMPVIGAGDFKMRQHRQYFVRSGSFLKAYEPDESQYTTRALYRPSDLGTVKLSIAFHRDQRHGKDAITTDIESTV